jgi:hypothetical protein
MSDTKTSPASKGDLKRVERAIDQMNSNMMGCCGGDYIDDTAAGTSHVGPYSALQVVGAVAAVLDYSQMTACQGDEVYTDFDGDITIPNGSVIYGHFNCVSLASGAIIAYKSC